MRKNYFRFMSLAFATLFAASAMAQSLQFIGVKNSMRYDDGDDTKYTYLGWNAATGKAEFAGDVGLWSLSMNGNSVASNLVHYDNLMYGNSGALYLNGTIYTVMSHEKEDGDGEMEFVVRTWDAKTYEKLSEKAYAKSANIESRGMAYNPTDGKVYGLFYLTDVVITDPDYEPDQDDIDMGQTTDAGYAICSIDLATMEIRQITPGVYYENFVTLTCSPEGRLFAMTSSGVLTEFSAESGLKVCRTVINEEGDVEEYEYYEPSGVVSQFKRQAACFDYTTGKMYWNGYVNSGKGYNDWGSYGPLSDKEWRTNGKYDTALYEVDIETGKATKISNIPNRIAFSCLWIDGRDASDLRTPKDVEDGVRSVQGETQGICRVYNSQGMLMTGNTRSLQKGLYIVNGKKILK